MRSKSATANAAQRWNELACDYESFVEPLTRQYAHAAIETVGEIGAGTRVLDVAAGTGALSVLAAQNGAQVVATDLSPDMVARLSERLAPYPHCVARQMDGQQLDTPDGAFDAAFSMFGVMLFPHWRRGLSELARATRKGGYGCVSVWLDPPSDGPITFLTEALKLTFGDRSFPPPPEGLTVLRSPRTLESEMGLAGFQNVAVTTINAEWLGPTVHEFLTVSERMYGFIPVYASLDRNERDRLVPALRDAAERYVADGRLRAQSTALIAIGRRS